VLQEIGQIRDAAKDLRGAARATLTDRLPALDEALVASARQEAGDAGLMRLRTQAADELATYRARLSSETWARSVDLGVDRLLREEYGLPTLTL
jgi:hypothetical protein